jgi:hypothetical protein
MEAVMDRIQEGVVLCVTKSVQGFKQPGAFLAGRTVVCIKILYNGAFLLVQPVDSPENRSGLTGEEQKEFLRESMVYTSWCTPYFKKGAK